MVRTSVTHSAVASCATFLFLPHFDVICDLLLNRITVSWNLFVKGMEFVIAFYQNFRYDNDDNNNLLIEGTETVSCR